MKGNPSPQALRIMEMIEQGLDPEVIKTKVKDYYKYAKEAYRLHCEKITNIGKEMAAFDRQKEALIGLQSWSLTEPVLQPNSTTRCHKLIEAIKSKKCIHFEESLTPLMLKYLSDAETFVVQHDWRGVLGPVLTETNSPETILPYDLCVFEFKISGRHVILLAQTTENGPVAFPFIEGEGDTWCVFSKTDVESCPHLSFAQEQIVAICIALEARVAVHEVQRVPVALNKKRVKNNKPPMKDFHVVDLSQRHRADRGEAGESRRSPRLHFRRGHWRHYSGYRVRIPWTLVGDPSLGFVDKMYKM